MKPIAYTLGEPAGIGPDIIILLAQSQLLSDIVCIGDGELLMSRAAQMGLKLEIVDSAEKTGRGKLNLLHQSLAEPAVAGQPNIRNVDATLAMLDTAIDGCLDGTFSALVTGPLHKGIINDGLNKMRHEPGNNLAFSGHTEYLAQRTNAELPVMLLATDEYRVALVTTHLPLVEVSKAITKDRIKNTCHIINADLKSKYGITSPRLMLAGLNPHAGEGGHLGSEEITTIIPAIEELKREGVDVLGPLPADTLFTPRLMSQADVAIAMYHDQGLSPLKALSFGKAANITLGLPIIRTSVDHGTALDLAGTGEADTGGLETAINVARTMARAQQKK